MYRRLIYRTFAVDFYIALYKGLVWDPIDLIFYRERASQPARTKRKRNKKELENGNQASKHCLFTCYQGRHTWPRAVLGARIPPPPLPTHSPWPKLVIFRD
jgi:hypothetical protein